MTGLPEYNYPAFNHAAKVAREMLADAELANSYELVFNPAESFGGDTTKARETYFVEDMLALARSERIILLPGWEKSAGARLEVAAAKEMGLGFHKFILKEDGEWDIGEMREAPDIEVICKEDTLAIPRTAYSAYCPRNYTTWLIGGDWDKALTKPLPPTDTLPHEKAEYFVDYREKEDDPPKPATPGTHDIGHGIIAKQVGGIGGTIEFNGVRLPFTNWEATKERIDDGDSEPPPTSNSFSDKIKTTVEFTESSKDWIKEFLLEEAKKQASWGEPFPTSPPDDDTVYDEVGATLCDKIAKDFTKYSDEIILGKLEGAIRENPSFHPSEKNLSSLFGCGEPLPTKPPRDISSKREDGVSLARDQMRDVWRTVGISDLYGYPCVVQSDFEHFPIPKEFTPPPNPPESPPSDGIKRFETGAVRSTDAEGFRYDLISPIALRELARTYAEGSLKYGDFNWEKGMPVHDLLNHAIPHTYEALAGEDVLLNLTHAAWGLMAAIHSYILWPHLNAGHLRGPGCTPPTPTE